MIGAALVWVAYYGQFQAHLTDQEIVGGPARRTAKAVEAQETGAGPVLGIFSTGPEIRNAVAEPRHRDHRHRSCWCSRSSRRASTTTATASGILGALITALVVVGIGLSLGGPTGYAINPARDLGPRIVHALLPLPNKGGSDWGYAWIPVVGPLIGGALAAGIYNVAFA